MKPKASLLSFLALSGSALLATTSANAATRYWDGTTTSANADGGAGTWINGGTTNWDTLPFGGADSAWTDGAHTAVFGGAAATVTVGTGGVTVGGLTFNANSYVINAGTNGLTFSTGTNVIQSYIGNNGVTGATITGTVGGTGADIVLSSHADQRIFTLTMNGTSTGGWTGTTTINAGTTMALSVNNQALLNTSGITLNGGTIQLTNTTVGESSLNRVNDSAAIDSYGSSTIQMSNTSAAGRVYAETLGSITHYNGNLFIGHATNSTGGSMQTLTLAGLTRSGTTGTIGISGGGSGAPSSVNTTTNIVRVNGIATSTAAGEIVGPWLTAGSVPGAQSDWAVYNSDGTYGRVVGANITASAESTWSTTHAATSNYTLNTNSVVAPANGRLTANRNINTLRISTGDSSALTVDAGTNYITMASNNFANGDTVLSRNTTGGVLTPGRVYYVINKDGAGAGTFQVSTTHGGSAVDLTTTAAGFLSAGVSLNGNTLGTYGIMTGSTAVHGIGGGSGSAITLPTTTSDNLYVYNGAASLWIDAPITDNGAGVLTLVKSGTGAGGSGDVTLSGTNLYTGGTVINSGTLTFFNSGSWVSGQDITFGGAGRINASVGALTGDVLDVKQGAVGYITGSSAITFTSTTGAGKISYAGASSATLALGDASAFTGDLQVAVGLGSNPYPSVTFSSIGDTAGSSIQFGAGSSDSNQRGIVAFSGTSALTLSNRQIQLLPRSLGNNVPRRDVLMNNSSNAAHKLVIQQDLLNLADRTGVEFQLDGSNTGNNEFAGDIGDSTYSNAANPTLYTLNVFKNGAGKWILSGDNTFTGRLLVSQGTLSVGTFNDSSTAGPLGRGSVIQLGGAEVTPVTGGSGLAAAIVLSGNNSGTLEYTGGLASTSRTFQIGSNATGTHTGGGTIANNGNGALTFTATNFNDTITGVSVARTLTLAGSNAGNNDVQGTIRDNVASTGKINLVKDGDGKWILSGNNSYTGTTAVNAGTLLINGSTSTSSAFTVAANATLGGTGDIGGSVTVGASGILSPGASIESLAAASLSMASGSTFAYEVANNTSTGSDLLAVDTTISLTGVNLSLDAVSLAALAGGVWNLNDKITLISYLGADITSGFTGYADDTSYFFGANEWLFNYNDTVAGGNYGTDATAAGQNRFVTMTIIAAVPEPRAALLGGLGLLVLLRRRRA